jgi:hypothetical protein
LPRLGDPLVGAYFGRRRKPLTKGRGEELAKRFSAGAASCAKREAAYLEWRIVISSKSSTLSITILAHRAEIELAMPSVFAPTSEFQQKKPRK